MLLACPSLGAVNLKNIVTSRLLQGSDSLVFSKFSESAFYGINSIRACGSNVLLATNQDLYRTSDSGKAWISIATPLSYKHIVSILPQHDTIYVGTAHGAIYMTADHGLTWSLHTRAKGQHAADGLVVDTNGVRGESIENAGLSCKYGGWKAEIVDSSLFLTSQTGVTKVLTNTIFNGSTGLTLSNDRVFIAQRRDGIYSITINGQTLEEVDMGYLKGEFVSLLTQKDGFLYAAMKLGQGGVARKPLIGTDWQPVVSDRDVGVIDVTGFVSSERGIYVGTREHGILLIGSESAVMWSLSEGLQKSVTQFMVGPDSAITVNSRLSGVFRLRMCGTVIERLAKILPHGYEYMIGVQGKLLLAGYGSGDLYRSIDDGQTWEKLHSPFRMQTLNTITGGPRCFYASTTEGAFRSIDSGSTWQSLGSILESEYIHNVVPLGLVSIIIGSGHTYLLRDDLTIEPFEPNVPHDHQPRITDAAMYRGSIYATGYPGLFRSDDEGRTWTVQVLPKAMVLRTLTFSGDRIYIATDMGDILTATMR